MAPNNRPRGSAGGVAYGRREVTVVRMRVRNGRRGKSVGHRIERRNMQ
jgi:hypothetical protein